ncbi:MAG: hypothetical protein KGZ86_07825 [Candidatus Latescibacteria bacterium]|nr:hypothetical protein [Candidatus Latescibacterota bacterium]
MTKLCRHCAKPRTFRHCAVAFGDPGNLTYGKDEIAAQRQTVLMSLRDCEAVVAILPTVCLVIPCLTRNPDSFFPWIPAYAGMTESEVNNTGATRKTGTHPFGFTFSYAFSPCGKKMRLLRGPKQTAQRHTEEKGRSRFEGCVP